MQPASDAEVLLRWCAVAVRGLTDARGEIDALNVYPVPDGDTGTNMLFTMQAAADAAAGESGGGELDVAEVARAMAGGALAGARGNSGIILAQLLRATADVLSGPDAALADARTLADVLGRAADEAFRAVADPVEGTILSVARAAAMAAADVVEANPHAGAPRVVVAAARSARRALSHTTEQLDVLREAGVVDAGGRGLTVLLDAVVGILAERRPAQPAGARAPSNVSERRSTTADPLAGPVYEVTFLLDAPDERLPRLKAELAELAESVVVAGGDGRWRVHVHTDDVEAAVLAGEQVGRPHGVNVSRLESAPSGEATRPAPGGP